MAQAHAPPLEPRQRWRLTFERGEDPVRRAHREVADGWVAALIHAGLPLPRPAGRPRSPLAFAAPLPAGIACLGEVADLWLSQLRPAWWVRERLEPTMPAGMRLLRLDDVWLGAPALAAAIRGAGYATSLSGGPEEVAAVADAAARFLASPQVVRERTRASGQVRHDIRPLVEDVSVDPGPPARLRISVRFLQDRGAGRPDEVIAALEELHGGPIARGATVREGLILDD